jgi:DNA topoisomerase III
MRLFIAEKPSLARAIADVLPGPRQRRDGYFQCGPDELVAWCAGHILELAPPDAYAPDYKQWRLDHLPITPRNWKLAVTAPDLLKTIKSLLPRANRVVHAGDPDREGQLLVDEVLEFLGYRGPVDRLLVSDLSPPAVKKAVAELQSNSRYRGLYEAALARQRADWLYGINLTRLYTLLGRAGGYDGLLSVGRVQTPLLGLVVRRDLEIERFQPRTYYVIRAEVRCADGKFAATWQPPEDAVGILDDAGRLVSHEYARGIQSKVTGKTGAVTQCSREKKSEAPPLPYSLPDLQVDAGKRLGLSPKQVLDACQALYETHRLLTYPRSDCPFLPEGQHAQATAVLAAVATNVPFLLEAVGKADRSRRSRAWNDKKVTAHHAIVPTVVAKSNSELSAAERAVYELVARRYLAQFYPAFEFHETKIEIKAAGELFRAGGRQTLADGWRALFGSLPPGELGEEPEAAGEEDGSQSLPLLRQGDGVTCREVSITEKRTTPPKPFTDSTLIQAMTGIARFVDDPKIGQLLLETDGIGTPATQAQIIETLFERRFIEKHGRRIVSTQVGRALIQTLPEIATRPDMTALWEAAMRRIADRQMPLEAFLAAVLKQLGELVVSGRALGALRVPQQSAYTKGTGRTSVEQRRPRRPHHQGTKVTNDRARS